MFYLLEFSRQFATDDNKLADKYLQFVRLFYVLMSMLAGFILVYTLYDVGTLTSVTTGIQTSLSTGIWAWGIIILLTMIFMGVYFLLIIPAMMKKALKLKEDGEEE